MPRVSTKKPRAKPAEETPAETPAVESAELTNGAVETAVMPEPSGSAALRPPSTPVELAEEPKVEEPRAEDRRGPEGGFCTTRAAPPPCGRRPRRSNWPKSPKWRNQGRKIAAARNATRSPH